MIKKEYTKPTMNVVRLKTQAHLLVDSIHSNEGLQRGGSGDMDNAYSRGSSLWDGED